jgi:Protein kinase domain
MTAFTRDEVALYVMGESVDPLAIEEALVTDAELAARVADDARFEMLLHAAGESATYCAGCGDAVGGSRCDACGAAIAPGGYVVERVLVSSAHGRMYVARDVDGRQVALKELAFLHSPGLDAIAAFEREAKFLRALDHPAIPRFVASFEEGTGVHTRYYLAQALVTGEPLDARLAEHWYTEDEIIEIARQVLGVLVYLQTLSPMVIHRDIKPANLLRRADGIIAVVDFGAAHVQGATAGSTSIGTFGYMPIEQLAGLVDSTTDPFALGASLLHLLGRLEPWRILQGGDLGAINVSRAMREFLGTLVATDPKDRFPTAATALDALERVAKGPRIMQIAERAAWRRPALYVVAALALAGTGIAGYALMRDDPPGVTAAPPAAVDPVEAQLGFLAERRDELCRCPLGDAACAKTVMDAVARYPRPSRFPDPGEKKRARTLMAEVQACARQATAAPATIQLRLPAGVTGSPWIDGVKLAVRPVTDGFEHKVAPGKHTIAVLVADGRGCEVELELEEGQRRDVTCTPTPPSSEPVNAPPSVLEANRVTGNKNIFPDDDTKAAIAAGGGRAVGSFKLCLDVTGVVTSVNQLKSTGFPSYDDEIMRQMRAWTYKPYAPDGTAMPVCTAVTFIFSAR